MLLLSREEYPLYATAEYETFFRLRAEISRRGWAHHHWKFGFCMDDIEGAWRGWAWAYND